MSYPLGVAVLTPNDAAAAAARMRNILATRRPQGSYDAQTVLGEQVVDTHAILFADLAAQIDGLRSRISLKDLQRAPAGPETDDATDAALSNLIIAREGGTFARGNATLHFTTRADTLISRNTRFFRTRALVFYLNSRDDLFVPAASMRAVYDARGTVATWAYDVSLIAARTGSAYNVEQGRFQSADAFSPYLAFVEATADFTSGTDIETSASAIARAPTAMSRT